MNPDDALKKNNAVLAELRPLWMKWLRLHHRNLAQEHEDVVQDVAANLIEYFGTHKKHLYSDEEIRKIGFTILKRRVADKFRGQVVQWAENRILDELPNEDASADLEKALGYRKVLLALITSISKLDKPSRELLLGNESTERVAGVPLSLAQRQRLSRLRAELRRELAQIHKIDISRLLQE